LRAEPDLARHRLAGRGVDRLDTAARTHRPSGAEVGTETAAAAPVLDRGPHHPPRPPHQVAAVSQRAVVRRDRGSDRPTDSTTDTDLTSTKPTNRDERQPPAGPVEPGPRPRSADNHATPDHGRQLGNHHPKMLRPGRPPHEISRLDPDRKV